MRTPEERIRLIQKRTNELKRERYRRRQRLIDISSVAACLVLLIGLGCFMPELMYSVSETSVNHNSGAASIIGSHIWLGYIIIGIFAFLLGMCVTVLLYRMHRREKDSSSVNG